MSVTKRAYLYIKNNKNKSFVLFLVLFVILLMLFSCILINKALTIAEDNVRSSFGGTITLTDKKRTDLTESFLDQLSDNKEFLGYNANCSLYADYAREDGEPLSMITEGAFDIYEGYQNSGTITYYTNLEESEAFRKKEFEVSNGALEILQNGGSDPEIMMHEALADKNNLRIGDTVVLMPKSVEDDSRTYLPVHAKIVATFKNVITQDKGFLLSHLLWENLIYVNKSLLEDMDENSEITFNQSVFQVKDPSRIPSILKSINMSYTDQLCNLKQDTNDAAYKRAVKPLSQSGNITKIFTILIFVVGIALLVLVLSMWLRNRIREVGILISLGISKGNIITQHVFEVLFSMVIALCITMTIGTVVASQLGNGLLRHYQKETETQSELDKNTVSSTVRMKKSHDVGNKIQEEIQSNNLNIIIEPFEIITVAVLGFIIIFVSVLLSDILLMRMQPRTILTKTN